MPKVENTTGMAINLIIDELKSDDIRKRIHSVKHLDLIASTIGVDRTKNELIPFLQELLDDEDEVLIELVESLSRNFAEFVGGQLTVLLPTFEALCRVEESSVREKVPSAPPSLRPPPKSRNASKPSTTQSESRRLASPSSSASMTTITSIAKMQSRSLSPLSFPKCLRTLKMSFSPYTRG